MVLGVMVVFLSGLGGGGSWGGWWCFSVVLGVVVVFLKLHCTIHGVLSAVKEVNDSQ